MTLQEILARMAAINQRKAAIKAEADDPKTTTERMAALDKELDALVQEQTVLTRQKVQILSQFDDDKAQSVTAITEDKAPTENVRTGGKYASTEYRCAFRDFVMAGKVSPILRGDESTQTGDAKAVIIPTTITDKLFERDTVSGSIFARVTKRNYPAGIAVPYVLFKPELEWVAENGKAERKKATTATITFNGYKGQIRLAISLEARTMSLEQFEAALLDRIRKAVARGFDKVIVSGDGQGKPTGIITGTDSDIYKTGNKKTILMNNKEVEDYAAWIKVWSELSLDAQNRAQLHINKVDWQAHILGMKDSNGKVIALETMGFGGVLKPIFMGREVVLLEEQGLPTFDSVKGAAKASQTTAFAYFFDDADYILNSNMQLELRNYIDEETDEKIHKATVLADGKRVDDATLLIVCRNTDAAA